MMGQSHICDECGKYKGAVCSCGGLPDGFEIGLFKKPYSEEKIELPYKSTKQLFLEKCFGEWFNQNEDFFERDPSASLKSAALKAWLGCAEHFEVPTSEIPSLLNENYNGIRDRRYFRMKKLLGIPSGSDVEVELRKLEENKCSRCGQNALLENDCHTGLLNQNGLPCPECSGNPSYFTQDDNWNPCPCRTCGGF